MNTSAAAVIVTMGFLTCVVTASAQTHSEADDPPIKLIGAERGSCAKGQLSTESGCVTPPRIGRRVEPEFPASARPGRDKCLVTLSAVVEKDGTVGEVTVLESTNRGLGFEESAVEALKKWRYKPARLGDKPIRIYFTVTVEFTSR